MELINIFQTTLVLTNNITVIIDFTPNHHVFQNMYTLHFRTIEISEWMVYTWMTRACLLLEKEVTTRCSSLKSFRYFRAKKGKILFAVMNWSYQLNFECVAMQTVMYKTILINYNLNSSTGSTQRRSLFFNDTSSPGVNTRDRPLKSTAVQVSR